MAMRSKDWPGLFGPIAVGRYIAVRRDKPERPSGPDRVGPGRWQLASTSGRMQRQTGKAERSGPGWAGPVAVGQYIWPYAETNRKGRAVRTGLGRASGSGPVHLAVRRDKPEGRAVRTGLGRAGGSWPVHLAVCRDKPERPSGPDRVGPGRWQWASTSGRMQRQTGKAVRSGPGWAGPVAVGQYIWPYADRLQGRSARAICNKYTFVSPPLTVPIPLFVSKHAWATVTTVTINFLPSRLGVVTLKVPEVASLDFLPPAPAVLVPSSVYHGYTNFQAHVRTLSMFSRLGVVTLKVPEVASLDFLPPAPAVLVPSSVYHGYTNFQAHVRTLSMFSRLGVVTLKVPEVASLDFLPPAPAVLVPSSVYHGYTNFQAHVRTLSMFSQRQSDTREVAQYL
ncbi:hypothetical protein J6590_038336 [Homalodisca vitripennis]|nr:hypothetical protein J6590_038336 [Homalodisca vitripennis]